MKIKTICTFLFLSTSLVWAGDRRILDLNFDLKTGSEIEVKLEGATVEIEGHNGRTLNFFAKIEGRPNFVESYDFDFKEDGDNLKIVGKGHKQGWSWSNSGSVNVKLSVPMDIYVWLQTSGADVRARNMAARMELRTSGGNVLVRDTKGVVVRTTGGNVELLNNLGECSISASGGNVYVDQQKGDADVRTSGGNIRMVAIDGAVTAKTSGGDIRIELDGANHGVDARTSGGDLYLYAKDNLNAELSARTSGGSVSVAFPMRIKTKRDDYMIDAVINEGGPDMILRSSGGDIKIREL